MLTDVLMLDLNPYCFLKKVKLIHVLRMPFIIIHINNLFPNNHGTFNVGTGKSRSFQEISDILQEQLGTNLGTEYFPNPFKGYQLNTQADISLTKKFLDFNPHFTLEMGIKSYLPEIKRLYGEEL